MRILKIAFSIFVVPAWLGLAPVAHCDDAIAWQLVPQAQVDSTGIFLVQLVSPPTSTVVPPQIRLAPAPHLGQTVSFSRSQIADLARRQNPELVLTNWTGAAVVRVSRRTRQWTEFDMTSLMTSTLQKEFVKDRGELEIHLTRPWTPVEVPDEKLTVKIFDMPSTGINPDCAAHCELWNGTERVGGWEVAFHASIWRDIPVAHSALTRGELLRDADISMERRDVLLVRDAYRGYQKIDDNLEMAENLPAGSPVLNRSVRVRPVILRGQTVDGVYVDGALSITLKVEALEDGLPGQTVRIRNPKTRHELRGKVQNEQTILIVL